MYGVPRDVDFGITGDRLDAIVLCEYQVTFSFDRGVTICVQSQVAIELREVPVATWTQDAKWSTPAFQGCIGAIVEGVSVPTDSELRLQLAGDWVIRIYDNSSQYESFSIYPHNIHV